MIALVFTSCLTTPASASRLRWSVGAFVDQWGDRTGNYFVRFDGTIDGVFSGGGWTNEPTVFRYLTFSETEGLRFHVSEALAFVTARDILFNILLPDGNTIEFIGHAQRDMAVTRFRYSIAFSEELLNVLLQEDIVVRLSTEFRQAQFRFPHDSAKRMNYYKAGRTDLNELNYWCLTLFWGTTFWGRQ